MTTLVAELIFSQTDPFLKMGPPSPYEGWIYRDFRLMPQDIWLSLIDLLGDENIKICTANTKHLPPNPRCRAQIFISPKAQEIWDDYIKTHTN